jgi:hypothetical protein
MPMLATALVVALLDAAFGIAFYWPLLHAATPVRFFKSIASAVLGRATASAGGASVVALGVGLHILVALVVTVAYAKGFRRTRFVQSWVTTPSRTLITGLAYGAGVWPVMTFIVIPLSRATPQSPSDWHFWVQWLWHMVGIGLPIVVLTERRNVVGVRPLTLTLGSEPLL